MEKEALVGLHQNASGQGLVWTNMHDTSGWQTALLLSHQMEEILFKLLTEDVIKFVIAVQSLSSVWLFLTPWTATLQAFPYFSISQSLLKLCPLSQWGHPTSALCRLLPPVPSIFPSIKVFSNESVLGIRWPKYWRFSSSISPSNEYSGLISIRIDWLDLLQSKSLIQHHSSKAWILKHTALVVVQLSHPHKTTGKT